MGYSMLKIKTIVVALTLGLLAACNTSKKPGSTGMFVKDGSQEWEVASMQTVADFKQALSAKQRVMLKQIPRFELQIQFRPDDAKALWHLSNEGYVTRTPEHGDAIYRIDFDVERISQN